MTSRKTKLADLLQKNHLKKPKEKPLGKSLDKKDNFLSISEATKNLNREVKANLINLLPISLDIEKNAKDNVYYSWNS